MAGVGAVKELSGITDNIIDKIDELEQVIIQGVQCSILYTLYMITIILCNVYNIYCLVLKHYCNTLMEVERKDFVDTK